VNAKFVRAGTLADLNAKGRLVVRGSHRPILVVKDQGCVYAFDNRCPHMGFPLDRGSVEDGIYLIRYLNVPPARLPGESDDNRLKDLLSTVEEIRAALLDAFDRQHRVDEAARLVARHLPHWRMRCCAKTRVFTPIKFLKPGCVSSTNGPTQPKRNILIAVARYLAASALGRKPPISRAAFHAATSFLRMPDRHVRLDTR
jgi:hypothetical protein